MATQITPLMNYLKAGGAKTVADLYPEIDCGENFHQEAVKQAAADGIKLGVSRGPGDGDLVHRAAPEAEELRRQQFAVWLFGPQAALAMNELTQLGCAPKVADRWGSMPRQSRRR